MSDLLTGAIMSEFATQLKTINACSKAVDWVGDRDLTTAWAECERADWMFWILKRIQIERKTLVSIACDCAERVLVHEAIEKARAWCRGEASIEDVRRAADTADTADAAADAAYAAAYAAANAAYAAAYAAANATDAAAYAAAEAAHAANSAAARAAAEAAYAAYGTYAAAYAANTAAYASERKAQADIIRQYITPEQITDIWEERT